MSAPIPMTATRKKKRLPRATAPRASGETRPTIMVSTTPITMSPICTVTTRQGEPEEGVEIVALGEAAGSEGVPHGGHGLRRMRPVRFERTTHSLEGCCSIQLSYGRGLWLQR